jgi:hypothetical protein
VLRNSKRNTLASTIRKKLKFFSEIPENLITYV